MPQEMPPPLLRGTLLSDRFRIDDVLGRGGFGIVYLAFDTKLQDEVVVKELAPSGVARSGDGVVQLDEIGDKQAHHLRQQFLEEARLLSRIASRGLPTIRAAFGENGTAYFAVERVEGAVSLESLLSNGRKIDPNGANDILFQLLDILEEVHRKGFLHRDVKPSNLLVSPSGEVTLIDFGAAREWHADLSATHTVLFTPGYAPLEQLSPKGRRGPPTDIYAICATAYHMLSGSPPADAAERAHGTPLVPLRELVSGIDRSIAAAIEKGLALRYEDRPQSVGELRELLSREAEEDGPLRLADLDEKLIALRQFSYDRRGCPSCGEVLEEPRPLKSHACPVCHRDSIRKRDLNERLCPVCRSSVLQKQDNSEPLIYCPLCRTGDLARHRVSFLASKQRFDCGQCGAKFESIPGGMTLLSSPRSNKTEAGTNLSFSEWRSVGARSSEVWRCDGCNAQFDVLKDGRRRQISPEAANRTHYPEEWARISARLSPAAGNSVCEDCGAEYEVNGDRVSLLSAQNDPFGFARRFTGRLLYWDDVRWLGAGKESPCPGLVCLHCGTEFDREGDYLKLVRTEDSKLIRRIDEPMTLEDWHRVARSLPPIHEEAAFAEQADDLLKASYHSGEIGFDSSGQILWNGPATKLGLPEQRAHFTVRREEIAFGGMLRKYKIPMGAVKDAFSDGSTLILIVSGSRDQVEFELDPVELTVAMKSGKRTVELGAKDLAARLRSEKELNSG